MLKNGVIYQRTNNKEMIYKRFGYRDIPNQLPINKTTSFPTASAGKVFVAVGILMLVEKGLLSLDTTLKDVINYNLGKVDLTTTIYELLTHTSSVPNYFDEEVNSDYASLWEHYPNYKIRNSKMLLPLFIHKESNPENRGKFVYNDSGFVLLGLVIEAITGKLFDQYIDENIFRTLGMNHTGYYELDRLPGNCANAYIKEDDGTLYTNIYSIDVKGTGAGGAYTNPFDITLFWDGLISGKLISKKTLDSMLTPKVETDNGYYGLGIWLTKELIPHFVGVDPGVTFISKYDIKNNILTTIISNTADNVFKVAKELS
jgi:CubicO group peptidase (beta-lactamase class C family)